MKRSNACKIDKEFMQNHLENIKAHNYELRTGFIDLDYCWGGLKKGSIYFIGARPGMGKTTFAINIANYLAVKEKLPVAIFSLDDTKEQLVNRILANEAKVDSVKLRRGLLDEDTLAKIEHASENVGNGFMVIDDTPGISVEDISKRLNDSIMDGVKVVFIDYLQLLTTREKAKPKDEEMDHICRMLKEMAVKHDVAVILLSQISRSVDARADKKPELGDIELMDAIVTYFDNISFIFREEYYNRQTEYRNIAEIITARSRNGWAGTVNLAWLPEYQKFCSLDRDNLEE